MFIKTKKVIFLNHQLIFFRNWLKMKKISNICILIITAFYLINELKASGIGYKRSSIDSARIAELYNSHLETNSRDLGIKAAAATTTTKTTKTKPTTTKKTTTLKTTTLKTTTTAKPIIFCPFNPNLVCDPSNKYQSFDGTCNNLKNPLYGAANTPYKRIASPVYDDGLNSPRSLGTSGKPLPNPRLLSTSIFKDLFALEKRWFLVGAIFGQFMVHDMTSLAVSSGKYCLKN
jgi:hypothetical protein